MRNSDYNASDQSRANELYDQMIGRLGIITADGHPRIIPVNFVHYNSKIYFHGAGEGEKYELYKSNPAVTFQIERVYSVLPSDWFDSKSACNATICYKSLYIKGAGSLVKDLQEKADALQALMVKHQDENSFARIRPDESIYKKALERTELFSVEVHSTDLKYKFAQNHSVKTRRKLIKRLIERDQTTDSATAKEIEMTLSS